MVKRFNPEKEPSSSRHSKKQKRSKHTKHDEAPPTEPPHLDESEIEEQIAINEEEHCDAPSVEHEEEIVCEGEVEFSDDGECVDVETAEEPVGEQIATSPNTPTPTKSNQPKINEKSTPPLKLSNAPSTSKAASIAATAAATINVLATNAKKRKGRRDSGTSSDEERWLSAIESGKLVQVDDEMKKMKDPKLMTARQRAMYERNLDKEPSPGGELLMSLPTGYKEKEKPQTAEDIQKAALKSQKRKQMADEKREKDKKKTMERLLKKQETKQRSTTRNKSNKTAQPMISYRNTVAGATITMPVDVEFPIKAQAAREPPKPQLCGIAGCGELKVYNCSKTKLPLCSFACYRKNVQSIKQIMC